MPEAKATRPRQKSHSGCLVGASGSRYRGERRPGGPV